MSRLPEPTNLDNLQTKFVNDFFSQWGDPERADGAISRDAPVTANVALVPTAYLGYEGGISENAW